MGNCRPLKIASAPVSIVPAAPDFMQEVRLIIIIIYNQNLAFAFLSKGLYTESPLLDSRVKMV